MKAQKVCSFAKFGFCKLREDCDNFHPKERCTAVNCDVDSCRKRHPKICMNFSSSGICKFGDFCKFDHQQPMLQIMKIQIQNMQIELDTIKKKQEYMELQDHDKDIKMKLLIDEVRTKHSVIKILRDRLDLVESWVEKNGEGWDEVVAFRQELHDDEAVDMKERSDENYQNEIDGYKGCYTSIKAIQDRVKDKPIVETIGSLKNFKTKFAENYSKYVTIEDEDIDEFIEQLEVICDKWINISKKQFKKLAILDLEIITKEIDKMYVLVCEQRKTQFNVDYEPLDKLCSKE